MISEKEIKDYRQEALEVFPSFVKCLQGKKVIHTPVGCSWQNDLTLEDTLNWLRAFKGRANALCLKTGKCSNVTVIDDDYRDDINPDLRRLVPTGTPYAQTGNGGHHFFFRYVRDIFTASYHDRKIDIRNDNGLIILPPSSIDARLYRWIAPFTRDTLRPMPEPLKSFILSLRAPQAAQERSEGAKTYEQLSEKQKKYLDIYLDRCKQAKKGEDDRSACDYALCCWVVKIGLSSESLWQLVCGFGKFAEPSHGEEYFEMTYKNALRTK